jgi:hypothetical protein
MLENTIKVRRRPFRTVTLLLLAVNVPLAVGKCVVRPMPGKSPLATKQV